MTVQRLNSWQFWIHPFLVSTTKYIICRSDCNRRHSLNTGINNNFNNNNRSYNPWKKIHLYISRQITVRGFTNTLLERNLFLNLSVLHLKWLKCLVCRSFLPSEAGDGIGTMIVMKFCRTRFCKVLHWHAVSHWVNQWKLSDKFWMLDSQVGWWDFPTCIWSKLPGKLHLAPWVGTWVGTCYETEPKTQRALFLSC
jgi:hypothetical protein